jgi:2-amino-4-hydroxy-6-hydroxymethyldihydropteridine diphosphokinase
MSTIAYIGLGSNLGDKKENCRRALRLLAARSVSITRTSSFYCTEPVGNPDQDDFINAVAEIETSLSPHELMKRCNQIESELGRVRERHWGPRIIDLDILLFGSMVLGDPDLSIPHPSLHARLFVLVPLCEIAAEVVHPSLHKTATELLREVRELQRVVPCGRFECC